MRDRPIDPVFSWSWATPFFVAILAAELFILRFLTQGYGSAFGALAVAWLMTMDDGGVESLNRRRLASLCFACAFLMVFVVCGDVLPVGRYRQATIVPLFGLILAGVVLRGTRKS